MNNTTRLALVTAVLGASYSAFGTDVTIRLTGSTAFRAAVFNALKNNYFDSTPTMVLPGNTGTPGTGSSRITFIGTKNAVFGAGNRLIVQAAYSGSVEGLVNVLRTTASSPVSQPKYVKENGADDTGTDADLAFSDVAQNTTTFPTSQKGTAFEFPAITTKPVQGVGVVTFAFVKNAGANANTIANVTDTQFQALAGNGSLSLGYFTANPADTTPVYLFGRYAFSGTRLTAGAVTGSGANAFQSLFSGDGGDFISGTSVLASDSATWNGVFNDGFVSGGNLAASLLNAGQNELVLGYLGLGDVRGAKNQAGTAISLLPYMTSYNGVAPSKANVIAGTYSFWSYEHLYGVVGTQRTDVTKFVNGNTNVKPLLSNGLLKALDTQLQADLDYVSLNQMKAQRAGDGGLVTPNF